MHRRLLYLLLSVLAFVFVWAKCPDGQHWVAEEKKCINYDQVITGHNGKCPKGYKRWLKACVRRRKNPIKCAADRILDPKTNKCILWLVENTKSPSDETETNKTKT